MISLILNELYVCINRKVIYILILIHVVILSQMYFVYSSSVEEMEATTLDAALKVFGGVSKEYSMFPLIGWLIVIVMLMLISKNSTSVLHGFDVMLLTRCSSKTKWWLSKVMALIIINAIYWLVIIVSTKVISLLIFENTGLMSSYSQIYYEHIYESSINPNYIELFTITILITGFIAISTLFQSVNIIFFNSSKAYLSMLIVSIVLFILYSKEVVPRWMSPLNYPSLLDLKADKAIYLYSIIVNLILTLVNIVVGLIIINRKNYKSLDN